MKCLFELSSEIPTIWRTLGWLDFGSVTKQPLANGDELTGILLKKPRLLSSPKRFQYIAEVKADIVERLIPVRHEALRMS
jgi:hypothetical protein